MAGMTKAEWLERYCSGRLLPEAWAQAKALMEAPLPPVSSDPSTEGARS